MMATKRYGCVSLHHYASMQHFSTTQLEPEREDKHQSKHEAFNQKNICVEFHTQTYQT